MSQLVINCMPDVVVYLMGEAVEAEDGASETEFSVVPTDGRLYMISLSCGFFFPDGDFPDPNHMLPPSSDRLFRDLAELIRT